MDVSGQMAAWSAAWGVVAVIRLVLTLDLPMVSPRRKTKTTQSQQLQAITDTNAVLQAEKTQLEKVINDLKAANDLQEEKIKSLKVAVSILLASSASLSIGLAASMVGATAQAALASAVVSFFSVITVSIAILMYMRRLP